MPSPAKPSPAKPTYLEDHNADYVTGLVASAQNIKQNKLTWKGLKLLFYNPNLLGSFTSKAGIISEEGQKHLTRRSSIYLQSAEVRKNLLLIVTNPYVMTIMY
jgi:hypothetical protein